MRTEGAVVRGWQLVETDGDDTCMNAASLVKQVIAHVALAVIDDLDEPLWKAISARHVLSHTTGLPNWRTGEELVPLREPGLRWGYSGEGFVILERAIEQRTGVPIDATAQELLFTPLGMTATRFDAPEDGYHGYRPLLTTAGDYGRFLAHVLSVRDDRWTPQWPIDDELAWGLGWGLELEPPVHAWQWGSNSDASNFVIGCPATGDGVVVFTDAPGDVPAYQPFVAERLPGRRAALNAFSNPNWVKLFN